MLCCAVLCRYVTPRPPVCGGKATLLYNSKAGPLAWIEDKRTKAQKDKGKQCIQSHTEPVQMSTCLCTATSQVNSICVLMTLLQHT